MERASVQNQQTTLTIRYDWSLIVNATGYRNIFLFASIPRISFTSYDSHKNKSSNLKNTILLGKDLRTDSMNQTLQTDQQGKLLPSKRVISSMWR